MRVALEPPAGLVSDDTTFASEGAWEDGNNVRFLRGRPQTIRGWIKQFNDTLTGVCRNALAWTENSAGLNIAFATHSALQVYVAGNLYDITPSGLAAGNIDASGSQSGWGSGTWGTSTWSTTDATYYPRTWSLGVWGGTLVACPRGGTLYQWSNNTSTLAAAVSNAPAEITAALVTPQRQVLAFGCSPSAGGGLDPLTVRGCAIEDLTTWAPDATNTAFEDVLEGGGRLITARMVGDYVAAWSDNALYMGEYTADTTQLYRWTTIGKECGIVGQNAVAVHKGTAVWVSPDGQFRSWSPGNSVEVVPCPIRNDFADNCDVSQVSKVIGATIAQHDEIWFFYPDSRDNEIGEVSRYVAVSLTETDGNGNPAWFRGQIARTAFCDAGVQTYPMGISYAGVVYQHENSNTADGDNLDWFIKSADQYIGNGENCLQLQGIWPDFEDQQGDVSLTVYVREYPQSTPVTKGPYTLSEGSSKKDFRASGRVAAIKFSATTEPSFARLGKPTFQAVTTGLR